ncbi:class I SAM-dependent methyltransferase [Erysipelotrichaceae bacterium HCN-30851]
MVEKLGNVILDYTFYNGDDSYSDGDIEEDLLHLVSQEEKSIIQILAEDNRWPILYHLSPVRKNILAWYDFKPNSSVLEIGAGCGAVTGILCEKTQRVTCIELSKRRSLINATRNKNYDNLKIMVGNFNDIELKEKYDYITLIGVLEYAAYYTLGENPFVSFLKNIKKYLKDDGKILIAIENKFGLKYWAGRSEDHTGVFFDSLENYESTNSKVRTFSKTELESMIQSAELQIKNFYYPMPDYKFPKQVFSGKRLPNLDDIDMGVDTYDNNHIDLFNQTAVMQNLIKSGQFEFFSNSFFLEVEEKKV